MATTRNVTLDVAKGLTLLSLPVIHSTLFYSTPDVQQSLYGNVLAFIAEGAGAPVFMLTMGIAITLGKQKTCYQILRRSLQLFLLAYLLNVLKFIVPLIWNGIPSILFSQNGIPQNLQGYLALSFIGDILQLAAIAYFICAFIYRLRRYGFWAGILAILVIILSPIVRSLQASDTPLKLLFNLVNGLPPGAFFPLFPWLLYPLIGLVVGYCMQQIHKINFYKKLLVIGFSLMLLGYVFKRYEPIDWKNNFYRLGPSGCLYHIGLAFIFMWLSYHIGRCIQGGFLLRQLQTLSKNVTFVYMLQWVIICWLLPVFGYQDLGLLVSVGAAAITTAATLLLTAVWQHKKDTHLSKTQDKPASRQ